MKEQDGDQLARRRVNSKSNMEEQDEDGGQYEDEVKIRI